MGQKYRLFLEIFRFVRQVKRLTGGLIHQHVVVGVVELDQFKGIHAETNNLLNIIINQWYLT